MKAVRFAIVCTFVLCGCGSHSAAPAAAAEPPSSIPAAMLRDTSLFLAGLPGPPDSAFHDLETTPAWQSYAERFDKAWASLEAEQFSHVRAFQARELQPVAPGGTFLFYPFSGPDVLYATQLFPQMRVYMLAGLEPVGSIRPRSAYSAAALPAELAAWQGIFNSLLHRSFFITGEMNRQLKTQHTAADGLLPVMLALLAREGLTATSVRTGAISAEGNFVPSETPTALELRFNGRILYYVSTDIGAPYAADKGAGLFVHKLGRPVTFIKSASFLPHKQAFTALRNEILESSAAILEDDTGVPYRFLPAADWDVRLFGNYSPPDGSFRGYYQKDLAAAFAARPEALTLDFPIGYGFRRRGSSLILAIRKTQ